MMWLFAILIVLALGGIAVVASGRGDPLVDAPPDRPGSTLPADRRLTAEDLRRVRFSLAFRGYRMSEVDALLDRLAVEREEDAGRDFPTPPPEGPSATPSEGRGDGESD